MRIIFYYVAHFAGLVTLIRPAESFKPMEDSELLPTNPPKRGERTVAFANRIPGDSLRAEGEEVSMELLRLPFIPHHERQLPILFINGVIETDVDGAQARLTVTTNGRQDAGLEPLVDVTTREDSGTETIYAECNLQKHKYTTGSFMNLGDLGWVLSLSTPSGIARLSNETTYGLLFEVR